MTDKRLRIILLCFLVLFGLSFLKLFGVQIFQHAKYLEEAKGQQVVKKEIEPDRGKIYVKDGNELYPLAANVTFYSVSVVPSQLDNKEEVAQKLSRTLGLNKEELFSQINNNKLYLPPIIHGIDDQKAEAVKTLKLRGVYLEEEKVRSYPEGESLASLIGFVNKEGEGQYGLEGYYNAELKGEKGVVEGEKDIKGRIIYYQNQETANGGADLILTIDRTIQWQAYKKLKDAVEKHKAKSGSIIIMDPHTGAIIAMASYPSFDPAKYNEVKGEDYEIFQNPNIAKLYEPGSVFKVITMAAGIDSEKITKDTAEYFNASIKIGGWTIWTWDKKPHGKQNMSQVLQTSNNVGAVYVVEKIGKELFYNYLKNFGFGSVLGIDLERETNSGLKDWKSWPDVGLATRSFGQGISVTPLQIVNAVSAIANGGKLLRPYVADEMVSQAGQKKKIETKEIGQVISPSAAQTVTDMMVSVVESSHGKRARVAGYKVAGKTGTAQIPKADGVGYEEGKTIGSFVGFAPADDPKFVMLVKLDEPQTVEWAESSVAPVFGEMAEWLLRSYWKIPPTE